MKLFWNKYMSDPAIVGNGSFIIASHSYDIDVKYEKIESSTVQRLEILVFLPLEKTRNTWVFAPIVQGQDDRNVKDYEQVLNELCLYALCESKGKSSVELGRKTLWWQYNSKQAKWPICAKD